MFIFTQTCFAHQARLFSELPGDLGLALEGFIEDVPNLGVRIHTSGI